MSSHRVKMAVVCMAVLLGYSSGGFSLVHAASAKKELRQSRSESGSDRRVSRKETKPGISGRSIKRDTDQDAIPGLHGNDSTSASRRSTGPRKALKKLRPKATLQPKQDLSYHGMLEYPQRYDPRLDRHKGGARNPQTSELLHEHYQELDKNHDGMLDPFERTLGRLDMDRDLGNRHWE